MVGVDKLTDLAVLKIDATNLPSIAWGDSTKLEPGETVLAFGSPFGFFQIFGNAWHRKRSGPAKSLLGRSAEAG